MSQSPATTASRRLDVVDGLRGIAIVLVVVSHGWILWPTDGIDAHDWSRTLFRSGNTAVTVFLVAAGFLTYRALASRGLERMRPDVSVLRRVLRVGPSLWAMLVLLLLVGAVDPTDTTPSRDNVASGLHVLTYTWNWYVRDNLLVSRPDFGHLWYLSVEMQAFLISAALLFLLRRRPVGVVAAFGGLWLLLTWWRFQVNDTEFVLQVLVRTSARMDPFVVGVVLGAVLTLLADRTLARRTLSWVATSSVVALVPLAWYCSRDAHFLRWGVTLLELDLAVVIGAVVLGAPSTRVLRAVSSRPLAFLGRNSLPLYIWHFPLFYFATRHTPDWSWPARTVVGLTLTAIAVVATHLLIERRVTRLLRHPGWGRLRDGVPAYVRRVVLGQPTDGAEPDPTQTRQTV